METYLPKSVVTASFFHNQATTPYSEIEMWCNREIALTQAGLIKRSVANDLIQSLMAAWDIVGKKRDQVRLTLWKQDAASSWKPVSKSTTLKLNPLMHPLTGINLDDAFCSGQVQKRDNTLIFSQAKLFNFNFLA